MNKLVTTLVAGVTLAASVAALPAAAQTHSGSVTAQGTYRGGTAARSVSRQPGSTAVTRGVQTNAGYGATTTRGGSWANGAYTGGATHTTNSGKSFGRSTTATATANGDGTGSYSSTVTGPNGQAATVSGSVSRTPPQN
jgi:hypothetical protein